MADEYGSPFLFLSANTPWVYALAEALAHDASVHAVRFYDWRVYWQNRPKWPEIDGVPNLRRTLRVMPTGYAGRLEWLARPFMRSMIDGWRKDLQNQTDKEPFVVVPYPYLAPWVRNVPENRLVYYNLDDYVRYRPERKNQIRKREDELLERAARTICLAQRQVETLRGRHSVRAERIRHFPLGVVDGFLNPVPEKSPTPGTVTYVGNMSDRVDWPFVGAVVEECAELTFRFVGSTSDNDSDPNGSSWRASREQVLSKANVEAIGRVPQAEVTTYYWTSAVNWIPYDSDHPFNVASCPTKIMDGLASGRPLVSTPVPECTLYPDWIDVASSPESMASLLRGHVSSHDEEEARNQVQFARRHTWDRRAEALRDVLSG